MLRPEAVVTRTFARPSLASAGTRQRIRVWLQETYLGDFTFPTRAKLPARCAPKPLPVIVTIAPLRAEMGANFPMCGVTVKLVTLVPEPLPVTTRTRPLKARNGTLAVSCVSDDAWILLAATPPKVTEVTPVNPLPVTVTSVPVRPEAGEKPLTVSPVVSVPPFHPAIRAHSHQAA